MTKINDGGPDENEAVWRWLGRSIVSAFDRDATASQFLRDDGEGGFASGIYRMAREIDRLREKCGEPPERDPDWQKREDAEFDAAFDALLAERSKSKEQATDHASTSPGPVNCQIRKRFQKEAYPRTCERCGLGPCPFFHNDGRSKSEEQGT